MSGKVTLQALLQNKLQDAQSKNKNYSLRAFAKKLDLGSGPVTEILKGNRKISRKIAEKIVTNLGLDPSERTVLLEDYPETRPRDTKHHLERTKFLLENMKLSSEQ